MRNKEEYELSKAVSNYLKLQYPKVEFRMDMAGLNLSMVQATMNKKIQNGKGWPDLFIAEPKEDFDGLFIELKKAGTVLFNKKGGYVTDHIKEQADRLSLLRFKGYAARFCIGIDETIKSIDNYMNLK